VEPARMDALRAVGVVRDPQCDVATLACIAPALAAA